MKKKYTDINTVLGRILNKHNLSHVYYLQNIKQNWPTFDKTIAAHAMPLDYDQKYKKLTLRVANVNWKKEFIRNKEILIVKIQNAFRSIDIKDIEIV
jgi:hypothetical protein